MATEGQLGVGIVKIKVDFKHLDAELDRVKTRVRKLVVPKIVLRIDKKRLNDDLMRVHKMITGVTLRAKRPIPMRIDTRAAHEKVRNLKKHMSSVSGHGVLRPPTGIGGGGGAVAGGASMGRIAGGVALGNIGASVATNVGRAAGRVATQGIMDNAEVETYLNSLKILLKDQEKANKLFKELQQMDLELPVDIGMLAQNAQKLAGAGFDPQKIEGLMRVLMDTASISPMGTNEGTSRIVRAFTQIRGKGNVQLEDLNQISELGVPIRQVIQEQFGMSAQDLGDKTRDGSMTVDEALEGIVEGLEKRFGGSLEARANTLSGMLDQVHDRFKALRREMMEPFFDAFRNELSGFVKWMQSPAFEDLTRNLKNLSYAVVRTTEVYGGSGNSGNSGSGMLSDIIESATFFTDMFNAASEEAGPPTLGLGYAQKLLGPILADMMNGDDEMIRYAKGGKLTDFESKKIESLLFGMGQSAEAYELARKRGDKTAMRRFRESDPELNDRLTAQENERAAQKNREKRKTDAERVVKQVLMGGSFGEAVATMDGIFPDVGILSGARKFQAGATNAAAGVGGFLASVAGGAGSIGAGLLQDYAGARNRFSTAVESDKFLRDEAQNRLAELIAANPELAAQLQNSELTSRLRKDKDGNFRTEFGVGRIGSDGGGMTQTTSFASLNQMLQGQVDQALIEENTKKSAELLEKLVDDLNNQQGDRDKMIEAMEKKTISFVGEG